VDCVEKYPYFLSFIEEGFVGVIDKTLGRIEAYSNKEPGEYAIDELRFLFQNSAFKNKEFTIFREKWDFKNVREKELNEVKKIIQENFYNTGKKSYN
jgi:hypothetical protein